MTVLLPIQFLIWYVLTKICKADFPCNHLLVFYLLFNNDYNHDIIWILNYVLNATRCSKMHV